MAGTNEFLPFGLAGGADVIDQATYAALGARTAGFSTGTAVSGQLNKVWRQSAFVASAIAQIIANNNVNAPDDGNQSTFVTNLLAALFNAPALTGNPTATTQTAGNNSTRIATTAFIATALASYYTSAQTDTLLAAKAPLASPVLTGTPTAPTAAVGTNSNQLASTAYVMASLVSYQTIAAANASAFPAGTRMPFNQSAAPTGWTKDTSAVLDDSIMRIVTGGAGSGGANGFSGVNASNVTGATTLNLSQIPSITGNFWASNRPGTAPFGAFFDTGGRNSSSLAGGGLSNDIMQVGFSAGGGGSHNHSVAWNIKYNDMIIAVKN